jgi:hypothetical protein
VRAVETSKEVDFVQKVSRCFWVEFHSYRRPCSLSGGPRAEHETPPLDVSRLPCGAPLRVPRQSGPNTSGTASQPSAVTHCGISLGSQQLCLRLGLLIWLCIAPSRFIVHDYYCLSESEACIRSPRSGQYRPVASSALFTAELNGRFFSNSIPWQRMLKLILKRCNPSPAVNNVRSHSC